MGESYDKVIVVRWAFDSPSRVLSFAELAVLLESTIVVPG